jgi:hypothetical protein
MPSDILIWKKKGNKFSAKITPGMQNNHTPYKCNIMVNLNNYKDLALFLKDLKYLWNAPIDKAIEEYKKENSNWPF